MNNKEPIYLAVIGLIFLISAIIIRSSNSNEDREKPHLQCAYNDVTGFPVVIEIKDYNFSGHSVFVTTLNDKELYLTNMPVWINEIDDMEP